MISRVVGRCWSVLEIVPQTNTCFMYTVQNYSVVSQQQQQQQQQQDQGRNEMVCSKNLSLERYRVQCNSGFAPETNWKASQVGLANLLYIQMAIRLLNSGRISLRLQCGWAST